MGKKAQRFAWVKDNLVPGGDLRFVGGRIGLDRGSG